ncbi:hypothetical protein GCM10007053_20670 [Halioglobus pacificus]|uniref:Uncharacterized protein n=1 Tax=Parahalioglobus pacificus TaxID=930806 RepID=A0A918XK63_9GAMM|nr:hypothetical protein GCM10007053_20670 [Halioglobus pacificus]
MGGFTGNGANIQSVMQRTQLVAAGIYHSDIVLLVSQMLGQSAANLAGAENNDFHGPATPSETAWHIKEKTRRM